LSFLQQLSQQSRRCLLFLLMAVVGSLLCLAIIFVCAVGENEAGGGGCGGSRCNCAGAQSPAVGCGCWWLLREEEQDVPCGAYASRSLVDVVCVCVLGVGWWGGHLRRGAATVPDASPRGASRRSSGCAVLAAQNANR
jgi:hypothetical protein